MVCFWTGSVEVVRFFFFFKQKTAYEIVSRDWSSDVCSSDLVRGRRAVRLTRGEIEDYGAGADGALRLGRRGVGRHDRPRVGLGQTLVALEVGGGDLERVLADREALDEERRLAVTRGRDLGPVERARPAARLDRLVGGESEARGRAGSGGG